MPLVAPRFKLWHPVHNKRLTSTLQAAPFDPPLLTSSSSHCARRLLLSGTPVQNHVLELWSLFDFLMPGFLGTEREFNAKYGKAVQVGCAKGSGRGWCRQVGPGDCGPGE